MACNFVCVLVDGDEERGLYYYKFVEFVPADASLRLSVFTMHAERYYDVDDACMRREDMTESLSQGQFLCYDGVSGFCLNGIQPFSKDLDIQAKLVSLVMKECVSERIDHNPNEYY